MAIELKVTAGMTFSEADPVLPPNVAVTSAVPVPTPVARPFCKIVATNGVLLVHVTPLLIFAVVPSE